MARSSSRVVARRHVAVIAGGVALLSGGTLLRANIADAHLTSSVQPMTCGIAGAISVAYGVEHEPLTVEAGKPVTLTVTNSLTTPANVAAIGVASVTIHLSIPAEFTGGTVSAGGDGNLTLGTVDVAGGMAMVKLNAAAGTTVGTLDVPTLTIGFGVKSGTEGKTIAVPAPSQFDITTTVDTGTGLLVETCKSTAGNPPLVSIPVAAATTPSTGATTSSTGSGTGTTSTTQATTSSTGGIVTSTTRATTSTTRSTTSTTRATTSTSGAVAGATTSTTVAVAADAIARPATPVAASPTFAG